jgi:hypothetical protein
MIPAFDSPHFIDLLIAVIAIEGVALAVLVPKLRRAGEFWWTLASGAALMLAVRLALSGAGALAMGAALSLALVAHILYLNAVLRK